MDNGTEQQQQRNSYTSQEFSSLGAILVAPSLPPTPPSSSSPSQEIGAIYRLHTPTLFRAEIPSVSPN